MFFAKQFFRFPCIILDGLRLQLQSGPTDSRTGVPLYGNDRTKFDRMRKPMVNLTGGWHTLSDPPHHRWEVSDIPVSLFVCMLWWGLDPPLPLHTHTHSPRILVTILWYPWKTFSHAKGFESVIYVLICPIFPTLFYCNNTILKQCIPIKHE